MDKLDKSSSSESGGPLADFEKWWETWESPPSWLFCKEDFEKAARDAWLAAVEEKPRERIPPKEQS